MNGVMYRLKICAIVFAMSWGMDYWVSCSIYSPSSPQTKSKSMKKHLSRTTASMSHKLMAITCNSSGALQSNKDFQLLLLGQIRWYPAFKYWPLSSSPKNKARKEANGFFQNTKLFTRCISMHYAEKSVLHYYVRFSQIQSHTTPLQAYFSFWSQPSKWKDGVGKWSGLCLYTPEICSALASNLIQSFFL